jgi:cytochrome P450
MADRQRPPQAQDRYPLLGHAPTLIRGPLDALSRWGETNAGLVRLRVAGKQFCLVTAPDAIEQVLATDEDRYRKADLVRDRLGRLQGGSLVLLEGEKWRERRSLLNPAFAKPQVQMAGPLTTTYASEAVEQWPTDRPVDLQQEMQSLSLSILGRALFGLDLRGGRTPIHDAADDIMARMDLRSPSTYLPEWVPTPANYRFRRAISTLHERLDAVVAESADSGTATADSDATPTNLFSIMRSTGLPDETIRDELIALLFAGFDSTATALTTTLGLLGANPEVQADLRRELDDVGGDETPMVDDIDDLPLLDAVVRESLRLYPPQYLLFREATEPVTLGGYRIEPTTTLVLAPWVVHRSDRFWADPAQFRPERWLEDGGAATDRPEFAYLPYGGGPRHCLGVHLANQTIKLVVAAVCQRRRLRLRGSLSVRAGPTLMPEGVDVRASHR